MKVPKSPPLWILVGQASVVLASSLGRAAVAAIFQRRATRWL